MRILLVEDQIIIALDTESMLRDLGAVSVHAFTTVETALEWLATTDVDIGVLDVGLGNATSFPVAELLEQRNIPFIFTTGYGDTAMFPERFLKAPIVRKPYAMAALAEAIAKCVLRR